MIVMTKQEKSAISRGRILDGARDLILAKGFSAMTVDAICKSAGITKGGLFHHFATKDELGLAALSKFWAENAEREAQADFNTITDPIRALEGYLDYVIDAYQSPELQKGCMLAIFTIELAESNEELFQEAAKHFSSWRANLIAMFERAALKAQKDIDAEAWTDMFISNLEGVLVLSKSINNPKSIKKSLSLYKQLVVQALA